MDWLKLYNSLEVMKGQWGYREPVTSCSYEDSALNYQNINFACIQENEIYIINIDNMHGETEDFWLGPSVKWYLQKYTSGLTHEICCDINHDKCLWLWLIGHFPGSEMNFWFTPSLLISFLAYIFHTLLWQCMTLQCFKAEQLNKKLVTGIQQHWSFIFRKEKVLVTELRWWTSRQDWCVKTRASNKFHNVHGKSKE